MREKFKMSCNKFDQYGILYLYDELNPDKLRFFREHLQSCAKCKNSIAEFERTKNISSTIPEISPPQKLLFRINLQARKEAVLNRFKSKAEKLKFRPRLVAALGLPVAALIILLTFYSQYNPQPDLLQNKHLAWSNGVDSAIDSLNIEIDILYPTLFSADADSFMLSLVNSSSEYSSYESNVKIIEQDIDILSLNYNQFNY